MLIRPKVVTALTIASIALNHPPGHCLELRKIQKRTVGASIKDGAIEDSGQGRLLASLFFPIFPQFHEVNYGDVLELLTGPNLIASFVTQHIITVR